MKIMKAAGIFKKQRGAQSTIEFTVLVMVIIGAVLLISIYFKRSIQGRWRAAVDELGEQYDPRFTDSNVTYRVMSNSVVEIATVIDGDGYWTMRQDQTNAMDTREGKSIIGGYKIE